MSNLLSPAMENGLDPASARLQLSARILVIDDEPAVGKLLEALLEAAGFDVVTALGGQEGLEALRQQKFSLALVDLVMPEFDGIRTLMALKQLDPRIQVIMMTGNATIDSTLAALRQGACDFLMKPVGMPQLGPAIDRALQKGLPYAGRSECDARRQQGQLTCAAPANSCDAVQMGMLDDSSSLPEAAKQFALAADDSRERLQVIFDGVETGIFLIDPATHRILDANPLALKLIGLDRARVLGTVCHKFVCPAEEGQCPFTDLEQKVDNAERILLTATGERIPIIKTVRRVTVGGRPLLLESFFDISARKRAEAALRESEDRYRDLVENSFVLISTHDARGRFLSLNRATAEILEAASADEVIGRSLCDYVPPHLKPQFDKYLETIVREGHAEGRMVIAAPSGKIKIVEYQNNLRREGSNEPTVRCICRDVTDRVEAEKAQAFLASCVESSQDAIVGVKRDGTVLSWNRGAQDLYGYFAEEIIGKPISILTPPECAGELKGLGEDFREGNWVSGYETVRVRRNGERRNVSLTVSPVIDKEGRITGSVSIGRDITEHKSEEKRALLQTAALESAVNGIAITDREGRFIWVNHAFTGLTGYSAAEALGQSPRLLKSGAHDSGFYQSLWKTIASGKAWSGEIVNRRKNGSLYTEEMTITPVRDSDGEISHFIAIKQDISERKRAEHDLARESALLRALMDNVPDFIYFKDRESRFLRVNSALARRFGLSDPAQVVGKTDSDFYAPEHSQPALKQEQEVIQSGRPIEPVEEKETWPDGRVTWASTTKLPLRDPAGNIVGTFGISRDITDRKRVEEELHQSRQMLQTILDTIPQRVFWKDRDLTYLGCNRSFANDALLGDPAEIIGKSDWELAWKDSAEHYRADDLLVMEQASPKLNFEESQSRPDGSSIWLRTNKLPLRNTQGEVIGIIGTYEDITEMKRAEAALQESEKRYRLLFSQMLVGFALIEVITNEDGVAIDHRWLEINAAFEEHTGLAREAVVGRTMREVLPGIEEFWIEMYGRVAASGGSVHFESYTQPLQRWFEVAAFQISQNRVAMTFANVSERKQAEKVAEERTAYLNTLFETSPSGIVVLDNQGRAQMSNSAFENLFGYSRGEIQGAVLDDLIVPVELAREAKMFMDLCLSGPGAFFTTFRSRKDRASVDVDINGVPLIINGELRGVLALYQDISERKRAEADMLKYAEDLEVARSAQEEHATELARLVEELAQERDLLGTLMDNIPDFIFYKDRECRLLRTNLAHARALGLANPREAVGKTDFDFFCEEDARNSVQTEKNVIESGQPLIRQIEKVRLKGEYRSFLASKVPIRDTHGRVIGLVGISRDTTEQLRAEEKIRESEQKYRSLVSNIPDVIWTMDADMQFTFISPNIERLSGFTLEEVYRCGAALFLEKMHDDDIGKVSTALQALFRKGEPYDAEYRMHRKDGELIWIHDRALSTYEMNGIHYADGLLSDISLGKRAEEKLRASEETYRELFENASDIVYTTDLEMRLISLNRVGQTFLGYSAEDATRMNLRQIVAAKHWEIVDRGQKELLAGERDITLEVEVSAQDGTAKMLEVKPRLIYRGGIPIGVQGIARDITGRDEAEMELRQAQKLESVGRLASGIAHEINTPIQFVGDNTRFLQDSFGGLQALLRRYKELHTAAASGPVSPELLAEVREVEGQSDCDYLLEEIPKALSQTLDGVSRVATIVHAMKEFAHPESGEMTAADLNRAIQGTLTVARNELKYVADVETQFGDLPPVVCNVGDLNQVFLNLLVNAAHAIADANHGTSKKGRIVVRTTTEGSTVLVTISDSGCGISEANRGKVFDPFFTTKEVGRGTGQGLAIAHSVVVDRHKGSITFDSELGKGTTFYVRLPVNPGESSREVKEP